MPISNVYPKVNVKLSGQETVRFVSFLMRRVAKIRNAIDRKYELEILE
jgi:hypothetical protein